MVRACSTHARPLPLRMHHHSPPHRNTGATADLALTARTISSQEALRLGLVTQVGRVLRALPRALQRGLLFHVPARAHRSLERTMLRLSLGLWQWLGKLLPRARWHWLGPSACCCMQGTLQAAWLLGLSMWPRTTQQVSCCRSERAAQAMHPAHLLTLPACPLPPVMVSSDLAAVVAARGKKGPVAFAKL